MKDQIVLLAITDRHNESLVGVTGVSNDVETADPVTINDAGPLLRSLAEALADFTVRVRSELVVCADSCVCNEQ